MWTYNYSYNNELYHYGILGMKWGVRRFQNPDGSLTPAGRRRYSDSSPYEVRTADGGRFRVSRGSKRNYNTKTSKVTKKTDNSNQNQEEAKTKKGLTDKQKKALKIGVAVAGTALVAYGSYKVYQLYNGSNQKIDPVSGFRLINKNLTDQQQLDAINPGRIRFLNKSYKNKEIIKGSSANCMLCTTAYELRQRGYDVHAGYSTEGFTPNQLFSKIYGKDWVSKTGYKAINPYEDPDPNTRKILHETWDIFERESAVSSILQNKINETITAYGPNARGNIMVYWGPSEGGHSLIWETKNGVTRFLDGQSGDEYKNFRKEVLQNLYVDPYSNYSPVQIIRTDNVDINFENVKNFINSDTVLKTYVDHGAEIVKSMAEEPVVQQTAMVTASGAAGGVAGYTSYKQKSKGKVK